MSDRISINPGGEGTGPFLTVSSTSDAIQFSAFILDVTPDQLRSLADELEQAQAAWKAAA